MLHFIIIMHITTKGGCHSFQTVMLASQDCQSCLRDSDTPFPWRWVGLFWDSQW